MKRLMVLLLVMTLLFTILQLDVASPLILMHPMLMTNHLTLI